jgi:hypothetical protein
MNTDFGATLYVARRYDDAIKQLRVLRDPDSLCRGPSSGRARSDFLYSHENLGIALQALADAHNARRCGSSLNCFAFSNSAIAPGTRADLPRFEEQRRS